MGLPENHPVLTSRPPSTGEQLADGIVHGLAILAGLIAFPLLLGHALREAGVGTVAALAVYAAGFFLMWGFSLAYNMTPPSALKWLLRRFDHSAIYLMIAGTYTAVIAQLDQMGWAIGLGSSVWVLALVGVVIKLVLPGRFDRAAVVAYVGLGWIGVIAIGPLGAALPGASLWLLLAGGMTYVAGIFFYAWSSLRFQAALWHLFVAVAAGLHFAAIAVAVA
ncbi:hemolysin III family protein [Rhodobacter sp. Har01]|uniref:PAQR family membrane homeostasis protein TrhA n=1 Tax=Rhodobacter sp. Har01 TaxID=2883999 RepID=UPI001D06DB87|nr:hemolysin III family protein [Rhodobacter sp. Har01]MCB6178752.1 hemolysin III family protein [Rhodobacter sp. Har01]